MGQVWWERHVCSDAAYAQSKDAQHAVIAPGDESDGRWLLTQEATAQHSNNMTPLLATGAAIFIDGGTHAGAVMASSVATKFPWEGVFRSGDGGGSSCDSRARSRCWRGRGRAREAFVQELALLQRPNAPPHTPHGASRRRAGRLGRRQRSRI